MKWKQWRPYVVGILTAEAVGFLSSLLSRSGTEYFNLYVNKPPLTPPEVVFPIVWAILYALMGISAARIWQSPPSAGRDWGRNLYVIQLVLNFFWSLIFFNAQAYGLASIWLVVLWFVVLAMIWQFNTVDPIAAWLQVPYLIWLTFAAYLAFGVRMLNR